MNGVVTNGVVIGIFISPAAGEPMQEVLEVEAIAGAGLKGDRYCTGEGSFNRGAQGKRQVTLINATFFSSSTFFYRESRRNIVTLHTELMWLIGRDFQIGAAVFRGIKYCDPCDRPSKLVNSERSFKSQFFDRGGLVAEILEGGLIKIRDTIIPPPKAH